MSGPDAAGGWEEALATRALRVVWGPSAPADTGARAALMPGIWAALRARGPAPGVSQDEVVEVMEVVEVEEGAPLGAAGGGGRSSLLLTLRHTFDHDFCSQYDRTEVTVLTVALARP